VIQMPADLFIKRIDLASRLQAKGIAIVTNSLIRNIKGNPRNLYQKLLEYNEISVILTGTRNHLDETLEYLNEREAYYARIKALLEETDAVLLVHNYISGEIQDLIRILPENRIIIADSLELARKAAQVKAKVIIQCGVLFMAETSKLLSPGKTVLIPEMTAGCSLADRVVDLDALRAEYPGAVIISYVNTTAQFKSKIDICCTSSNAQKIVESCFDEGAPYVVFVPDQNLGRFIKDRLPQELKDRFIVYQGGYCHVHEEKIKLAALEALAAQHPSAIILAHGECNEAVTKFVLAQGERGRILSTGNMLKLARDQPEQEYIVATEIGIMSTLIRQNPNTRFYHIGDEVFCEGMKSVSLAKIVN
jgi:quinolinate synthase